MFAHADSCSIADPERSGQAVEVILFGLEQKHRSFPFGEREGEWGFLWNFSLNPVLLRPEMRNNEQRNKEQMNKEVSSIQHLLTTNQ